MKEIRIGMIGFGTVGSGLAQTLINQQERLVKKSAPESSSAAWPISMWLRFPNSSRIHV